MTLQRQCVTVTPVPFASLDQSIKQHIFQEMRNELNSDIESITGIYIYSITTSIDRGVRYTMS